MPLFHHILFPVDFSPGCTAAAPFVSMLARRFQARATMLHAMDLPPGAYADWYSFAALVDLDLVKQECRRQFSGFLTRGWENVNLQRALVEGEPAHAIVQYAQEHDVDLIVMPTHGLGSFRRLLLGSVTAKVLHDAPCPVWTEAHVEDLNQRWPVELERVACAIDLGPRSRCVVQWAARIAKETGASLIALHAVPRAAGDEFARRCEAARAQVEGLLRECEVKADVRILAGEPADAIPAAAQEGQADLLVVGQGRAQESLGRLRAHAYGILRHSASPVLCV